MDTAVFYQVCVLSKVYFRWRERFEELKFEGNLSGFTQI